MPCRDGGGPCTDPEIIKRLDLATSLLCAVMQELEDSLNYGEGGVIEYEDITKIPGLKQWWHAHKMKDFQKFVDEANHHLSVIDRKVKDIKALGGIPSEKLIKERNSAVADLKKIKEEFKELFKLK